MTQQLTVEEEYVGQRIDNFLFTRLKGAPKSRVYRAIRGGEVRVNKKRIAVSYKLQLGDVIRIPPLRLAKPEEKGRPGDALLNLLARSILYEDKQLIIINKPSGMAAHGGSGIHFGAIETMRHLRPKEKFLELVHRLDRDTSGCMMIAKKPSVLKVLQAMLSHGLIQKRYLAVVQGVWQGGDKKVQAPLLKNVLQSGERLVKVHSEGKASETLFHPLKISAHATLVEVTPKTGRTHQIRVHAQYIKHPVLGDDKYGDKQASTALGVKRLLLHAASLQFQLPETGQVIAVCACLDQRFKIPHTLF